MRCRSIVSNSEIHKLGVAIVVLLINPIVNKKRIQNHKKSSNLQNLTLIHISQKLESCSPLVSPAPILHQGDKVSIFVGYFWENSDGFALNRLEHQTRVESFFFKIICKLVDMNSLVRRKQVDSVHLIKNDGHHQLAKKLSAVDLVAIGMRKIQTLANFER